MFLKIKLFTCEQSPNNRQSRLFKQVGPGVKSCGANFDGPPCENSETVTCLDEYLLKSARVFWIYIFKVTRLNRVIWVFSILRKDVFVIFAVFVITGVLIFIVIVDRLQVVVWRSKEDIILLAIILKKRVTCNRTWNSGGWPCCWSPSCWPGGRFDDIRWPDIPSSYSLFAFWRRPQAWLSRCCTGPDCLGNDNKPKMSRWSCWTEPSQTKPNGTKPPQNAPEFLHFLSLAAQSWHSYSVGLD